MATKVNRAQIRDLIKRQVKNKARETESQSPRLVFEDVEVLPKPLQDPMPVWIAASSENALDWAGEQGLSIMIQSPLGQA